MYGSCLPFGLLRKITCFGAGESTSVSLSDPPLATDIGTDSFMLNMEKRGGVSLTK